MHLFVRTFYLIWMINSYFDWQVGTSKFLWTHWFSAVAFLEKNFQEKQNKNSHVILILVLNILHYHSYLFFRATRWMTFWPLTSAWCWQTWTNRGHWSDSLNQSETSLQHTSVMSVSQRLVYKRLDLLLANKQESLCQRVNQWNCSLYQFWNWKIDRIILCPRLSKLKYEAHFVSCCRS